MELHETFSRYEFFARSLEGQNSCLLVDFTRSSKVTSAVGVKQSTKILKMIEQNQAKQEQKATTDELNRVDSALAQDNVGVFFDLPLAIQQNSVSEANLE